MNSRTFRITLILSLPWLTLPASARRRPSSQEKLDSSAAAVTQSRESVQVQFAFRGNAAQVPAQVADSLVLVPVRVNGSQPSWFLLDTSRASSTIDDVRAVAVGLYSPSSEGKIPKSFSNVTLEFPGLRISLSSLSLGTFGDLSARVGHVVQGVLGMDILSQLVVKIDYQADSVQFYDPKGFNYAGRGVQIPVQVSDGIPSVTGRVILRHRGKFTGLIAIATGQTEPLNFSPHFAAAHFFSGAPGRMLPFPGEDASSDTDIRAFLGRVQQLQIAKISFNDPIAVLPVKSARGSGIVSQQFICAIGGETLSRFTVILNTSAQMLILEPDKSFADIFSADMSGLSLIAIPPAFNKFEVAQVARKSPAAAAGVAIGDMIAKIDDRPASDYTLDDIRGLLRQDGLSHKLTLLRSGKSIDVVLTLKPLI